MKQKQRILKADLNTIMPLLIQEWRKLRKLQGPGDHLQTREFRRVVEGIVALQEDFDYTVDRNQFDAYMLYYWPLFYQQALSVLGELPRTPRRVLDISAGLSPMSFAALRHGSHEVYATDPDLETLRLGAKLCGQYDLSLYVRRWDCTREKCPIDGTFDLIILGHCLTQLYDSPEQQAEFLKMVTRLLSEDGYLVLIDRSFPKVNEVYLKLRDALVEEGFPVQAPCVWKGKCPALEARSQCYAQRDLDKHPMISEFQRAAKINLGSLKMTYLIFKHPNAGFPSLPDKKYYRVISPPFETIRGKSFYLCGVDGKKKLSSNIEHLPKSSRAFDYLKRGELISVESTLESNNHYEITEDSKIALEAPLGKPIPEETKEEWNEH